MNKISEEPLLSLPERHNRILTLLQQNGSISVTQLSDLFRVSEVTIRKDLSYLEQQKKLYRTHGSAILISPYIGDRHVNEKEKKNVSEKQAIGVAADAILRYFDYIRTRRSPDGTVATSQGNAAPAGGGQVQPAQPTVAGSPFFQQSAAPSSNPLPESNEADDLPF